MKKVLVVLGLLALMVVSLGNSGALFAKTYYEQVEEAIPAQPVE